MDPATVVDQSAAAPADLSALGHRGPIPKAAGLLWHDLHALAHAHFELAALETQQAGESLVAMVVAGVLAAGLLLAAWLALMGAAILALASGGVMGTAGALLLVASANLLAALVLWRVIVRLGHRLRFPANARGLQPASPERPDGEIS